MQTDVTSCESQAAPRLTLLDLWTTYHTLIHQQCLQWTGGREADAADALGQAFFNAFQHWPESFNGDCHARAWLLTIAHNVCRDLDRQRRKRSEISLEDEQGAAAFERDDDVDPERLLLDRERRRVLHQAVTALPPLLRDVVEAYLAEEKTFGEIARELGIAETAVRKRMQQAREQLRLFLSGTRPLPRPPAEEARRTVRAHPHLLLVEDRYGIERDVVLWLELTRPSNVERRAAWLAAYIERFPGGWRKRLELARILAMSGRFEEAIPHYLVALERSPFPLAPWLELGSIHVAQGRPGEAERVYGRGSRHAGRPRDRILLRVSADIVAGWLGAARKRLAEAIAGDPDPLLLRTAGELALSTGRPDEAMRFLDRAAAPDPHDPRLAALRHDGLLELGREAAAVHAALEAFAVHPADVQLLDRVIGHRIRGGEHELAEELLEIYRAVAPSAGGPKLRAAQLLAARGRAAEAAELLSRHLDRHGRHGAGWMALASVRLAAGAGGDAVRAAMMAVALDSGDRTLWIALCEVLTATASAGESGYVLAGITGRFGGDVTVLRRAARLAAAIGRDAEAAVFDERAQKLTELAAARSSDDGGNRGT